MPNWREVLEEINRFRTDNQANQELARQSIDVIRRKYLLQLHIKTGRNVIAYYSGFLSKPGISQSAITDEDKNGFMMAVHGLQRDQGLDLILHTPGGNIAATQSLVNYLHKMFGNNIRAIIPQISMSAGTMLACSCKSILMGKQSNLGPIDPHLRDIPTYGVLREFKRAYREVKKDPTKLVIWQSIISQYRPTFLGQCENAVKWSNSFVKEQLEKVMFLGDKKAKYKANKIVQALSSYTKNKVHDRHIHAEECEKLGLTVEHLEAEGNQDLQDLVLTVHHCFMHTIMNTRCFKIIENHKGVALVKQEQTVLIPQQFINPQP
jgi:ClpP class serine protease